MSRGVGMLRRAIEVLNTEARGIEPAELILEDMSDGVSTLEAALSSKPCEACKGRGTVRTGKTKDYGDGTIVHMTRKCRPCFGEGWVTR